jgi:hypothetical protein
MRAEKCRPCLAVGGEILNAGSLCLFGASCWPSTSNAAPCAQHVLVHELHGFGRDQFFKVNVKLTTEGSEWREGPSHS